MTIVKVLRRKSEIETSAHETTVEIDIVTEIARGTGMLLGGTGDGRGTAK